MPAELAELSQVPGVGAKRAKLIKTYVQPLTRQNLKRAAQNGMLQSLPGIGIKTQTTIEEFYRA
jgi:DNA polymerase/3'-5' exonuclease PolX